MDYVLHHDDDNSSIAPNLKAPKVLVNAIYFNMKKKKPDPEMKQR